MRVQLFSKLAIAAAACLLVSSTAPADEQEFAGNYQLISATRKILDTGEVEDTFGKQPKGLAIYGKEGRFSFSSPMTGGPSRNRSKR